MPKVYIVIVNFNGWRDTIECLESLLKLVYSNFQIIVVDNSTSSDSFHQINSWALQGAAITTAYPDLVFPESGKPLTSFVSVQEEQFMSKKLDEKIILVKAKENNGFAAGNNLALKYMLKFGDGQFAWLLNNDTVVAQSTLGALVTFMAKPENAAVGIAGGKVLEYSKKDVIQSAGGGVLIKPVAYSFLVGAGQTDSQQFDTDTINMDFVAGTSMFVRADFLSQVGLLNEVYFLYFEEPDWVVRGKRRGWKIGYCYQAKIYHKGGASTGGKGYSSDEQGSTPFSDFYFQRAKILFTRSYYYFWLPVVYLSFTLIIFNRIRRRQFDRVRLLISLIFHPHREYPQK